MKKLEEDIAIPATWKRYLWVVIKFFIVFYICMLTLAEVILRQQHNLPIIVLSALIFLVIQAFATIRMIKKLPMGALMLAAPIVPLIVLIFIVTLIPTLPILDQFVMKLLGK